MAGVEGIRSTRPSSRLERHLLALVSPETRTPVSPFMSWCSWLLRRLHEAVADPEGVPGTGAPVGVELARAARSLRASMPPGPCASGEDRGPRTGRGRSGRAGGGRQRDDLLERGSPRTGARGRRSRGCRRGRAASAARSPWLIACAARTISERAAWRKISVSLVGRDDARRDQVLQHAARADGRELVDVAHEQHVRARPDRARGARRRDGREHRGLVDDQQVDARDRVVGVAREALARDPFEQPVDRWSPRRR